MSNQHSGFSPEGMGARLDRIQAKLGDVIGETHPRLSDVEQRHTVGDLATALLTYGQIVARTSTDESPHLPEEASEVTDPVVTATLAEFHLAELNFYLSNGYSTPLHLEDAGFSTAELQDLKGIDYLHPKVEGYDWYRGHLLDTGNDSAVLVFQPWMMPWGEGGSPFPVMYSIGEPEPADVQNIAFHYGVS